ncbi:lytic polysaccharide monooxygenase [Streptomyces sp. NPDC006879]|uniref:lytic polysaccharide monooxygenase auxiliary activity family 9 protein n=1 Tax=Streptomyces sp. NPDC006879 TaxID=3364767 RepID=UPI00369D0D02
MTARRKAVALTAFVAGPCALVTFAAGGALAHGSMTDPVSRVAACHAEGPESPKSAACKAAVAASGTQAFYDWNEVNIADAAGKHRKLIPDGKLCSAGRAKYKGLDLPRADWPASRMSAGTHTFRYKGTAPHRGSFELYLTKEGYDPKKPLKWSDLESQPFVKVTDPKMEGGDYVFSGTVPRRAGRHLIYSVWQRSDSPEAFYTCSDVVFGKGDGAGGTGGAGTAGGTGGGTGGAGTAGGTGGDHTPTTAAPTDRPSPEQDADQDTERDGGNTGGSGGLDDATDVPTTEPSEAAAPNEPEPNGSSSPLASGDGLAETGGSSTTPMMALGGAGALAAGAAVLFATARRKAASGGGSRAR